MKSYLEKNHSSINFEKNSNEDLFIMGEDLKKAEIFLTGENHGVKANIELRMKFLKYFKEKTNFKYYLYELPYSVTYFLGEYLKTGDEAILKEAYEPLKGTYGWNRDEYDHWKDLYEFNKTLSKEDRIIPIGIDIEHQPKNAFKFIETLLDKASIESTIKSAIGKLKSKDNIENEELKELCMKIKDELNNDEKLYKSRLKENYLYLKLVNDNLLNMIEVYSSNNFNGSRDEIIYENFIKLYGILPKDKYFGQIGLSHVFQRPFEYVAWFASSLNKEGSTFEGEVISVAYAYSNSRYLYPTLNRNYRSSVDTFDLSIDFFSKLMDSNCTLFKLNGLGSPFEEELIWPFKHKFPEGGVSTDYFQYLLVVKDSKEMEEL